MGGFSEYFKKELRINAKIFFIIWCSSILYTYVYFRVWPDGSFLAILCLVAIFFAVFGLVPFLSALLYAVDNRIRHCPKCGNAMKKVSIKDCGISYSQYDRNTGKIYHFHNWRDTYRCENCGYEKVEEYEDW